MLQWPVLWWDWNVQGTLIWLAWSDILEKWLLMDSLWCTQHSSNHLSFSAYNSDLLCNTERRKCWLLDCQMHKIHSVLSVIIFTCLTISVVLNSDNTSIAHDSTVCAIIVKPSNAELWCFLCCYNTLSQGVITTKKHQSSALLALCERNHYHCQWIPLTKGCWYGKSISISWCHHVELLQIAFCVSAKCHISEVCIL